jgi:hypothetical protein
MRTVALSIFKPTHCNGRASNQSPAPVEHDAKSRARSTASLVLLRSFSACALQHMSSQARCEDDDGGTGVIVGVDAFLIHDVMADAISLSMMSCSRVGRRASVSSVVLSAEAK